MESLKKKSSLIGGTSKKPDDDLISKIDEFPEIKIDKTPFTNFIREKHLTLGEGDEKEKYYKTDKFKRTSINFGQLKLLLSEIQFINNYWDSDKIKNPIILYIGAAGGEHINILAKLYPQFEYHLYDKPVEPFKWSENLFGNDKITIYDKYFTDEDMDPWGNKDNVFLISDVRSLSYERTEDEEIEKKNENLVDEDMRLQEKWVKNIKPVESLLKFRLPVPFDWQKEKNYKYFDGLVYFQQWELTASNELRIVPFHSDGEYKDRNYNIDTYSSLMFYHRNTARQKTNFVNILNGQDLPIAPELGLTNDYDSIASIFIISEYLMRYDIEASEENVINLMKFCIKGANDGSEFDLFKIRNKEKKFKKIK